MAGPNFPVVVTPRATTTTGERGKPTQNFDFLDAVSNQSTQQVGNLALTAQDQATHLSELLNDVNTSFTDIRKRKRDTDIAHGHQANMLAERSDQIHQQTLEAAADPFNGIKALFGGGKTMAEWAAEQNLVQNELNSINRRYASKIAGYSFEMGEQAQKLALGRQKLQLTRENLAAIREGSAAIQQEVVTQMALQNQQLMTMTLPELVAEFEDPKGQIPGGMIEDRIWNLKKMQAEAAAARSSAGKSQLERRKLELEVLDKYAEFIDESVINFSIANNVDVKDPTTGIVIRPQDAEKIQVAQQKALGERAKILADLTMESLQGGVATAQTMGILVRSAGFGETVFTRDENGQINGFDPTGLTPELQGLAAQQAELVMIVDALDTALELDPENTDARQQTVVLRAALSRKAKALRDNIAKTAVDSATRGIENDLTKEGIADFVEFGKIRNEAAANNVLMANTMSAAGEAHGVGWSDAFNVYAPAFRSEWDGAIANDPDLFKGSAGEDGEIDSKALLAAILGSKVNSSDAPGLASMRALHQLNPQQQNLMQDKALNAWYEVATNHAIRMMMENHAGETETTKALDSLILGTIALSPAVTQVTDENGVELDGVNVLFSRLGIIQEQLKQSGALPETADLVNEFRGIILNNKSEIWKHPDIVDLTTPRTEVGAAINRMIFNGRARDQFIGGLQKVIQSAPTHNMAEVMEFARLQKWVGSREMLEMQNTDLDSYQAQVKRFHELKNKFGDTQSLAKPIRILTPE